ncbi:TetR/AcrR family transcriptional regulator [Actinoplanes sp. NPDC051513]|uniref:TetR/AcrR family transcriptional regulator n=1 Tax=Actinoplanes sp. NPDC051513 TaxID=3363908 RepID=UPI0037A718B8
MRQAILDTTAALVSQHGLRSVTMSQIAEQAGIGRATLYKYFPDIEAILHAWHALQITGHLQHLAELRDQVSDPYQRLAAVLQAYALISHQTRGHQDLGFVTFLHQDEHLAHAQRQLHDLVRELIADGAEGGHLRGDVTPDELAGFCLHALNAAATLPSPDAVRRLVQVTMAGLRVQ